MDAIEEQLGEPLVIQPRITVESMGEGVTGRDCSGLPDVLAGAEVKERIRLWWKQACERRQSNEHKDNRQVVFTKLRTLAPYPRRVSNSVVHSYTIGCAF